MLKNSHSRAAAALTAAAVLVSTSASTAGAEAPARSATGATLVVPDAQQSLGTVYYVDGGPDVQVTFTSDAPIERIVGTSSAVVGYVVVSDSEDSSASPLLAGAFRLPVASFDTGLPMRNGHLVSDRWMDAATNPDVTFELTGFTDATVAKEGETGGQTFKTWEGTITGNMTVKGVTKPFSTKANLSFVDLGDNRGLRGGGKKLAIRCQYPITLSEYGIDGGEQVMGMRMSDEIMLDQFLMLSPGNPEDRVAQMNERAGDDRWTRLLLMRNTHTNLKDTAGAVAIGDALITEFGDNTEVMNTLANMALNFEPAELLLARRAAEKAIASSEGADPLSLDTMAEICFAQGDIDGAVAWQEKAVAVIETAPERMRPAMQSKLAKYKEAAGH
jgi:polyisoprenoid-binding protein YceI